MTRVKISLFILLALISMSVCSGIWVDKKCSRLIEITAQVGELYSSDEIPAAVSKASELDSLWQSFRKAAGIMVKSDKLSEIDRINARIIPMLETESEELSADIRELEQMLETLKKGENPTFTSIF